MTPKGPRQRLDDILDAIGAIERFTQARSLTDYLADRMLRDAVERNVERISEATRHLSDAIKEAEPGVPWRAIADIGNVLRHGYDSVNDRRVWAVVEKDLVSLKQAIRRLIEKADKR